MADGHAQGSSSPMDFLNAPPDQTGQRQVKHSLAWILRENERGAANHLQGCMTMETSQMSSMAQQNDQIQASHQQTIYAPRPYFVPSQQPTSILRTGPAPEQQQEALSGPLPQASNRQQVQEPLQRIPNANANAFDQSGLRNDLSNVQRPENGIYVRMPLLVNPTEDMVRNAARLLDHIKQEISTERELQMTTYRYIPEHEWAAFHVAFKNLRKGLLELHRIMPKYLACTKDVRLTKAIVNIFDLVDRQRLCLQPPVPGYILDVQMLGKMQAAVNEMKMRVHAMMRTFQQQQVHAKLMQPPSDGATPTGTGPQQNPVPKNLNPPSSAPVPHPPSAQSQPPQHPIQSIKMPIPRCPLAPRSPSTSHTMNFDRFASHYAHSTVGENGTPYVTDSTGYCPTVTDRGRDSEERKVSNAPPAAYIIPAPPHDLAPGLTQMAPSPEESSLKRLREDETPSQPSLGLCMRAANEEIPSKRIKSEQRGI